MNKHKITEEELIQIRKNGLKGKLEALKHLENDINADLRILELKKCSESILYFKENYLLDFFKSKRYENILKFIDENNFSNLCLEKEETKQVISNIYIIHKFLFEVNINIGIATDKSIEGKSIISELTNILNKLPSWMKQETNFLKKSIKTKNNSILIDIIDENIFRGRTLNICLIKSNNKLTLNILDYIIPISAKIIFIGSVKPTEVPGVPESNVYISKPRTKTRTQIFLEKILKYLTSLFRK